MKEIILFICLIMAATTTKAETIYAPSDLSYVVDTFIDKKTNKPATGIIKENSISIPIKNGKEHGKAMGSYYGADAQVVFDNGNPLSSEIRKEGKLFEKTTFYKGTSVPATHEVYYDYDGTWLNGKPRERYQFTEAGFLSDFVIYEKQKTGDLAIWAKGHITDTDGKLELPTKQDTIYFGKSIVLDSKSMELDPKLPHFKESDLDINKEGKMSRYLDKKGNAITGIIEDNDRFYTVKAGLMNGPYKSYRNGKLLEEGMYKNGQRIVATAYDENGNKTSDYAFGYSENLRFREPSHIYIRYYNGHPVKVMYAFFNGFSIGTRFYYHENGQLAGKAIYSTPDKERDYIYQEAYSESGTILSREMRYINVGDYTIEYDKNGQPKNWKKEILGIKFFGQI